MLKTQAGFTLVEVLVAIGIFLLIIGGITWMLIFGLRSNKIIWEQLSTQNEGRKVVQDFVNEIRTATASSIGAYAIASAEPQQVIFYSNIDSDAWRERVRYFLQNGTLKKGVLKPSGNPLSYNPANEQINELAHDVINGANPVFYYYDQSYTGSQNPLAPPVDVTKVRMIKFTLDLEEDPNASPMPFHVETMAEVRNLKSN